MQSEGATAAADPRPGPAAARASKEGPAKGLSIRGVSKAYYGNEVLSDIDLDVRPGEVVALIGENGAGKSTLSGIIAGSIAGSAAPSPSASEGHH